MNKGGFENVIVWINLCYYFSYFVSGQYNVHTDFLLNPIGTNKQDYDTLRYIQLEYHTIPDKDQYIFVLHMLNWMDSPSCTSIEDGIEDSIVVQPKSKGHTWLFDHHIHCTKHMDHTGTVCMVKSYFCKARHRLNINNNNSYKYWLHYSIISLYIYIMLNII